jgi:hypothetical protein
MEVQMKYALLVILFTAMSALCFGILQFDLGIDVAGITNECSDEMEYEDDYNLAIGISPAIEFMMQHKSILYGIGAEYQVQRKVDYPDTYVGDFKMGFIPIYLVGRYQFTVPVAFQPEVVAQAGYNILTGNDNYEADGTLSGGIYWGVGAGVTIQEKYLIQLMYKTNYGQWEWMGAEMDITNSQINIGLGYRF